MTLTLRVLQTTTAKLSTAQARSLPQSAKSTLAVGNYEIVKYSEHPSGHFSVSFKRPFKALDGSREYQTWFVWGDDIELAQDGRAIALPKDIILPVPFFAQMATKSEPTRKTQWEQGRTCFSSSMAMALKYKGAAIQGDDDYYFKYLKGDSTDWGAQIAAADRLGFECYQRIDADFDDLKDSIDKDCPVVIGILHRGGVTKDNPPRGGGHIICVCGYKANGDLVVNDPYGSVLPPDSYTGPVENGRMVTYPREVMQARWTVDGPGSGWAMFFK